MAKKRTAKPHRMTSMQEMIGNSGHKDKLRVGWDGTADPVNKELLNKQMLTVNEDADLKQEAAIKKYNEELKNLSPLYSSMIPMTKVLVRCFHQETVRNKTGLIILPTQASVKLPTRAGHGYKGTAESPYLYSRKAVIVAVPERYMQDENGKVKPGTVIQLENPHLVAVPKGDDSFDIDMPNAFTHYSYMDSTPPKNPESEHFGYLLVSIGEIQMILDE